MPDLIQVRWTQPPPPPPLVIGQIFLPPSALLLANMKYSAGCTLKCAGGGGVFQHLKIRGGVGRKGTRRSTALLCRGVILQLCISAMLHTPLVAFG